MAKKYIPFVVGFFFLLALVFSCVYVVYTQGNTHTSAYNTPTKVTPNKTSLVRTDASNQKTNFVFYRVISVVDGDTFQVNMNGKIETVRVLGIDTPETVDPKQPVGCYGKQASQYADHLLYQKLVRLETDTSQDDRDVYGRLLRYVWLEDGTFFNEKMLREGYAREYTFIHPYYYQTEFTKIAQEAQTAKRGLWGACR